MKLQGNLGRAILRYGYAAAAVTALACGSSGSSGDSSSGGTGGTKSGSGGSTAKGGATNHAGTKSTAEAGAAGEAPGEAGAANGATSGVGGGGSGGGMSTGGDMSMGAAGEAGAPGSPENDACAQAKVLPFAQASNVFADTRGAEHDIDPPCASNAGPDVFYEFTVSKRVFVYADTFGATWNTVLYLLSDDCKPITTPTTAGDAVCSGTACGGSQSQIVALLEAGKYKLGLSGRDGAAGIATIHLQFASAGSGTAAPLPAGNKTITGTTTGASGNMQGLSPDCLAAGPENAYWWASCPNDPGGAFSASTCGGASWETVLALELPASKPYSCSLDSCSLQASIMSMIPAGAGLRVLAVDGEGGTDKGAYTLTVTRP